MMQISTSRTFSAIAIIVMMHMMVLSPLQKVCCAFTLSTPKPLVHRAQNAVRKSNMRLYISSSSPLPSTQEHGGNTFFSTQDIERELNRALDFARDMDKKYGLCTSPSQEAWAYVDEIYQKIQAYKDGSCSNEHHAPTAQGPQSSPGRNRKRVLMGSRNGPSEREMKGRRYFF